MSNIRTTHICPYCSFKIPKARFFNHLAYFHMLGIIVAKEIIKELEVKEE